MDKEEENLEKDGALVKKTKKEKERGGLETRVFSGLRHETTTTAASRGWEPKASDLETRHLPHEWQRKSILAKECLRSRSAMAESRCQDFVDHRHRVCGLGSWVVTIPVWVKDM